MIKYLLAFLLLFAVSPAHADLNYKTYYCPSWPCPQTGLQPLSTGTVPNINYDWGGGYVLNSGRADFVSVNFTGFIVWPGAAGQQTAVTFYVAADDGTQLDINNQNVYNDWGGLHGAWNWNVIASATGIGGEVYPISMWFSEWGGGAAVRLYWNAGGIIQPVAQTSFLTSYTAPAKNYGDGGAPLPVAVISQTNIDKMQSAQQAILGSSSIYIENRGNNNTIWIEQKSTNNIVRGVNGNQRASIIGNNNNITLTQGTSGYGGNVIELSITGDYNTHTLVQSNNNQYTESKITGWYNNLNLQQKDSPGKTLLSNINGNNNIVSVLQQGYADHYAEINVLTNGNNIVLNQAGNAQKVFSLTINSPNVGVTVNQLNILTADSAAMAITCTTGPCNGYSYTKN